MKIDWKFLDLTTEEVRRIKGDFIQQFKLSKGLDTIHVKQVQIPAHSISANDAASSIRDN
jgi:hypothetical protein